MALSCQRQRPPEPRQRAQRGGGSGGLGTAHNVPPMVIPDHRPRARASTGSPVSTALPSEKKTLARATTGGAAARHTPQARPQCNSLSTRSTPRSRAAARTIDLVETTWDPGP